MIYTLTLWQIWIQATQLYTQKDPKISAYETSYLTETPISLPEMKQQIRLGIVEKGVYVKDPDPRAVTFIPFYQYTVDGEQFYENIEFDWCNEHNLDHLNMANSDINIAKTLCLKDGQNIKLQGFQSVVIFRFEKCN